MAIATQVHGAHGTEADAPQGREPGRRLRRKRTAAGLPGQGPAAGAGHRSRFRTDIQALRALAVGLVVLNHLWPLRLPGGYVGVDVFFVISGYLISSHLLKELEATGRVRLAPFYSRRARRLFPAAFLVLAASMAAAMAFLPYPRWVATAQEVLASVFYAENWLLAARAVDYSAQTEAASAVQHYWSLSVEEQFYLFWPLGLTLLALLARRAGRPTRRVLFTGVLAVAALSLACSIWVTSVASSQAYFATPVRIWEFAAGALLALAGTRVASRILANILALLGFGMVVVSALTYDTQTPFPGWTALLPVVGTALVILSGSFGPLWHDRVTALRPVQFIGGISYSLYLWHWPLIVVAPFAFGTVPLAPHKLALLAASVLLAWLTKRWVEDVWIRERGRHTRRGNGFFRPAAGMVAVALAAASLAGAGTLKEARAAELAAAGAAGPCYGAAALGNRDCGDPFAAPVLMPHMGTENEYWHVPELCAEASDRLLEPGPPATCDFSGGNPSAEVVWVVGDSHAQQWMDPIMVLAQERGWIVKWTLLGACPLVDAPVVSYNSTPVAAAASEHCSRWAAAVTDAVEADRPQRVFLSMYADQETIDDGTGRPQMEQYTAGLTRIWQRWVDAGITVVPITDPPLNGVVRSPECLALNADEPLACAVPREDALGIDPLAETAARMNSPQVRGVDLTDFFCDLHRCYAAVGGVSVYFDANHLNAAYSRQLAAPLAEAID